MVPDTVAPSPPSTVLPFAEPPLPPSATTVMVETPVGIARVCSPPV
jgi:hypothetical protein